MQLHYFYTLAVRLAKRAGYLPVSALALPVLLSACGGGGGGEAPTPPPPPPTVSHSIGGTVSGLSGSGLVLQNNGGDNLSVSADGNFTFATEIDDGNSYSVTVATQPASPDQTCTVSNGSGTATADVSDVAVSCITDSSTTDTDGDGLTDVDEIGVHGTSPILADTDGDGYTDFDEIVTNGFDPAVNNFIFNPRVADIPVVLIEIEETPIIGWNYVEGTAQGTTTSTSRSQAVTNSSSTTFGASTTIGVEATSSATAGASATGPSAEVSQSVSVSASATVSFDTTNTQENQSAWEEMRSNDIETTRDTQSGFMRFGVRIRNGGHLTFKIQSLSLSSTRTSEGDDPFIPTGTLNLDGTQSFPATSIGPNSQTPLLTFEQDDIDLGTVRSLLTNSRSIQLEPLYEIVDRDDVPFPFREQDVASNTAKILIDYGPHQETEFYQVATNSDHNSPGQTLEVLLSDFLVIPSTSDSSGLSSVRTIQSAAGRWVITRNRKRDTELETTIFDSDDAPYNLAGIDVRARDEILLVLLEDADGDNIGYREELIHGTNANDADSDNDGINDFDEIRDSWTVTAINQHDSLRYPSDVFSSPTSADYDQDSLDDAAERSAGLDPYNADTDGDGIRDNLDNDNGNLPLVNNSVLSIGIDPFDSASTEFTLALNGTVTARSPNVVANADIDWASDGVNVTSFSTLSGGDSSTNIDSQFGYGAAGSYTVTLSAVDDENPANSLLETADIVFTEASAGEAVYGNATGWYSERHVRELVDLNQDGLMDIVGISNSDVGVSLGAATGFAPRESWSVGHWHYGIYNNVREEPRLFADIDADGRPDIIGVDIQSTETVLRYGLNNMSAFDDPVDWLPALPWSADTDSLYIADVDNSGFPDVVHAAGNGDSIRAYTNNGSSLQLTPRTPVALPAGEFIDRDEYPVLPTDIDGDGCVDLVYFGADATWFAHSACDGQFAAFQMLYEGFGRNDDNGWQVSIHKRWVDDVNNDGLPDLIGIGDTQVLVLLNRSASGVVEFGAPQEFGDDFVAGEGWADDKYDDGEQLFNVHPRYLADVNNDGYKDLVGFAGVGAAIGINQLGIDGTPAFAPVRVIAPAFANGAVDANGNNSWWSNNAISCERATPCREYFSRKVGDVDGDGRVDLIGFDRAGIVLQFMPYTTQF